MESLHCKNIRTSVIPPNPSCPKICPVFALSKYVLIYPIWLKVFQGVTIQSFYRIYFPGIKGE